MPALTGEGTWAYFLFFFFTSCLFAKQDVMMLGAVGAYAWSGTVVHLTGAQADIFPSSVFENILQDRNHSALLGKLS